MKSYTDEKLQGTEGAQSGKQGGFKKKNNNKHKNYEPNTAGDFFKGIDFSVGPHALKLYLKTKERVSLYASTQFKNGSDLTICILEEKLVKPEVPLLEDEHTAHEKRVWEYRMGKLMKTRKILEGNLHSLFMVQMSICDSDTKNQVEKANEYPDLEKKLDLMGLLNLIIRLVYTGGTNDRNARYNKVTAFLNLMNLHQDRFSPYKIFETST